MASGHRRPWGVHGRRPEVFASVPEVFAFMSEGLKRKVREGECIQINKSMIFDFSAIFSRHRLKNCNCISMKWTIHLHFTHPPDR